MTLQPLESSYCFSGYQKVYTHWSKSLKSKMRFGLYLPPAAELAKVPVLYWLSGLTCTEQNFITKAGAQRIASMLGIALVTPDTSPRGLDIPAEQMSDVLGEGASFYLDATEAPWYEHYKMYTYISKELPQVIAANFPIDKNRCGIFGHSMGGHGALMIGLRNPELFRSLSAFSPICSPMNSSWGMSAFKHYLGSDIEKWREYDACHLVKKHPWPHGEILLDQGSSDPFLAEQLKPELFSLACLEAQVPLNLRLQKNYNHNYYFISTFIEDHLRFHTKILQ